MHSLGPRGLFQAALLKRTLSALVDCIGSLSAPGRRHAEPEAGVGDEEPANPPAGEENYRVGEAGESLCLLQRLMAVTLSVPADDSAQWGIPSLPVTHR